jgi:hypothetical protein
LDRACQRLWLFGSDGAFSGSLVLDISLSLALNRLDAGSDRDRLTVFSIVVRQRYVVSTAFDPAVTSYADVDRLLRTEPQVQLTPFVLNNHSNSPKSHGGNGPLRFSLACLGFSFLFRGVQRGYFSFQRERSEIMKVDELLISAKELPWRKLISLCPITAQ